MTMEGRHAESTHSQEDSTVTELRQPLLRQPATGSLQLNNHPQPARSNDHSADEDTRLNPQNTAVEGFPTQATETLPVNLSPTEASSALSADQPIQRGVSAEQEQSWYHSNVMAASGMEDKNGKSDESRHLPARGRAFQLRHAHSSPAVQPSPAPALKESDALSALFGAIAVTVANTFLGAAALSALLIHSLGAALAVSTGTVVHQHAPVRSCLQPQAAILTHFITLSFAIASIAAILIAAFLRNSSPQLSTVALWAGVFTFAGAFSATITALSFMALAQLGCTALGWTAFGLVIGVGGAVPLIFACSILVCHMIANARRRRSRQPPVKGFHYQTTASQTRSDQLRQQNAAEDSEAPAVSSQSCDLHLQNSAIS